MIRHFSGLDNSNMKSQIIKIIETEPDFEQFNSYLPKKYAFQTDWNIGGNTLHTLKHLHNPLLNSIRNIKTPYKTGGLFRMKRIYYPFDHYNYSDIDILIENLEKPEDYDIF